MILHSDFLQVKKKEDKYPGVFCKKTLYLHYHVEVSELFTTLQQI